MFCGECGRPVNTRGGRSSRSRAKSEPAPVTESVAEAPVVEPVALEVPPEQAPMPEAVPEPFPVPAPFSVFPAEPEVPAAREPEAPEPVFEAPVFEVPELRTPEPSAPAVHEPAAYEPAAYEPPAHEVPAPVVTPAPTPATADAEFPSARCAQCGAPLTASDIFCPECGFVRQRESARARSGDTNVLDPFPWGLPRSTEPAAHHHAPLTFEPDAAPAATSEMPGKPFADISDVSETRLVPRGPRGDRFVLQFSTGESVSVSGTGLIGRNPVAEPGEYFDTLVAIVDPGRSVSKTHLEFGQDDTSFWVSDRYSGNGTVMREPDREPRRCEAGKRYRVIRGTRVEIGEQFFIVS